MPIAHWAVRRRPPELGDRNLAPAHLCQLRSTHGALHKTRHQNMALRDRAPASDFRGPFAQAGARIAPAHGTAPRNRCPFRKFHPAWDSHRRAESSHDWGRCLHSFTRSECSSSTCSSRGAERVRWSRYPLNWEAIMRFKITGILLLSAVVLTSSAAAQTTPAPLGDHPNSDRRHQTAERNRRAALFQSSWRPSGWSVPNQHAGIGELGN
jgi:hypothetical protein